MGGEYRVSADVIGVPNLEVFSVLRIVYCASDIVVYCAPGIVVIEY